MWLVDLDFIDPPGFAYGTPQTEVCATHLAFSYSWFLQQLTFFMGSNPNFVKKQLAVDTVRSFEEPRVLGEVRVAIEGHLPTTTEEQSNDG